MKNADTITACCDQIDVLTEQIRTEAARPPVPPRPPMPITVVAADDDLQSKLQTGGLFVLEAGGAWELGYSFEVANTALSGVLGDTTLGGDRRPALTVPMQVDGAILGGTTVRVEGHEVAVQLGRNDTQQNAVDLAPRRVLLHRVLSAGHRGKRCIEVDAADVWIIDCDVRDLYDPEGQDSQAIWIGNAPGPVLVEGGYFEAASENLMVGGDQMKIPNCRPTGITVRDAEFHKPLAWRDQGVKVKNILELKDGHDVLFERCALWSCWKSAQDGYAFMFTPTRGGSLRNVVVRDCRVWDVGGIVNITGIDTNYPSEPRTQVSIIGGEYRTNTGAMGGTGRFCLIGRGPEWFIVEDALIAHEGSAFIDVSDKAPVDLLRVAGSTWNYGQYGIRIGGYNHGDNQLGIVAAIEIEGNTISGAHSQFRDRYPHNTYVDSMSRDREIEVDGRAEDYAREVAEELARVRRW